MITTIPRLPIDSFDWLRWLRGADIWISLGFKARYFNIKDNAVILRLYAVGYIPANRLSFRCKPDEMAVMFLINDEFCWTHLRMREFEEVFCA
jgi:hypothetical protein